MSWLEDHVNGIHDVIAISTASVLPDVQALAKEAEDAHQWWSAALRWNMHAIMEMVKVGSSTQWAFLDYAVKASANVVVATNSGPADAENCCTQFELDSFNLNAMSKIILTWDPVAIAAYGERVAKLATTEAGKSRPVLLARVALILEWLPGMLTGDPEKHSAANWRMSKIMMNLTDARTDAYSRLTEAERYLASAGAMVFLFIGGDNMMQASGFTLDVYGPNGDNLLQWANACGSKLGDVSRF
jgi:hypothetical protein